MASICFTGMSILDFIIAYLAQCPDRNCPDVPKVNFESFFIQSHVRLELLRKDSSNSCCALLRWQGTVLPNVISSKLFVFSFLKICFGTIANIDIDIYHSRYRKSCDQNSRTRPVHFVRCMNVSRYPDTRVLYGVSIVIVPSTALPCVTATLRRTRVHDSELMVSTSLRSRGLQRQRQPMRGKPPKGQPQARGRATVKHHPCLAGVCASCVGSHGVIAWPQFNCARQVMLHDVILIVPAAVVTF